MNPANMTEHQSRIADFMKLARQTLPQRVTMPSEEIRKLRAWLILEEALETIDALGFCAEVVIKDDGSQRMKGPILIAHDRGPNMREVADGCADISVVTIGTLLAFGIADKPLLEEVDRSNLAKFELPKCPKNSDTEMRHIGGGRYECASEMCDNTARGPYRREDGKWIKGPDWKEPDIDGAILDSNEPATIKSWTPEQFDECKNQLIAFQEFKAAEELVSAIRRMRIISRVQSGESTLAQEAATNISRDYQSESGAEFIQRTMQRDSKTPYCYHCRGILSNKLISNMIDRNVSLPCPDCQQLLNLISVVYA